MKQFSQEFVKSGAMMLIMPGWSKDELRSWWQLELKDLVSADRFERLFEAYGGIIRHVLELPSFSPKDDSMDYFAIQSAIDRTSVLEVCNLLYGNL